MEKTINIFIVEDSEIYSFALENSLKSIGNYRLKSFPSAEEALQNFDLNPDLVILDYYLPGISGLEAMKKMDSIKPGIPVIILSVQDDIQIALNTLESGAYEYIIKNKYAPEKLFHAINKAIQSTSLKEKNVSLKNENRMYKILFYLLGALAMAELLYIFFSSRE